VEHLREALERAGFTEQGIAEVIGSAPHAEAVTVAVRRLPPDDPRAALIRLFVLGEPVPVASLPVSADELEEAGLVARRGDFVQAPLRLTPFEAFLFAHDGVERMSDADYVTGANAATRTLATLTIRRSAEHALDLGTGCGVQAVLAARHSEHVVATDVNDRALRYGRLNARLNGARLDLREGSLFEPLEDERFDLVVSNPPFVISPDHDFSFRDSGVVGDEFCRAVVRGAAKHLRAGGFATILCNWICRDGDGRLEPVVPWVEETGCDALLLGHEPVDPFHYAARWNEPLRGDADAYAAALERWLAYYERNGVAAIGIGAVVLRRRDGSNWLRGLELERPATGAAGEHLLRLFGAADAPLDDTQLLDERLRLVSGHRLEQRLVYRDGYQIDDVSMALDNGVGIVERIDPTLLPLLFALTPERALGAMISDAELAPEATLPTVRRLLENGFLERA
jgi:methylase of polypeptide subunit release factors